MVNDPLIEPFEEPYWVNSARTLARLLANIPGLKDSDLGEDPQKFLAEYVPPAGTWDKRSEGWRSMFVHMGEKQFRGIYDTYLEKRDKPGFRNWEDA
jgi:hypothetical protein